MPECFEWVNISLPLFSHVGLLTGPYHDILTYSFRAHQVKTMILETIEMTSEVGQHAIQTEVTDSSSTTVM